MPDGRNDELLDIPSFAKRIKEKYSEYADVDDLDLVERIVRKNPTYATQVRLPEGFRLLQTTSGHQKIDDLYEEVGRKYNVDPNLLLEQGRQETSFNPDVFYGRRGSSAGARGSGQFIPGTAKRFDVDVNDPMSGIDGQARYMRELLDMFDGNEDLALAGYNAGEHRKSLRQGKIPPFEETEKYVKNIKGKLQVAREQNRGDLRRLIGTQPTPTNPVNPLPGVPEAMAGQVPQTPLDVGIPAYNGGQTQTLGGDVPAAMAQQGIAQMTETPAGRVLAGTIANKVAEQVVQQQAQPPVAGEATGQVQPTSTDEDYAQYVAFEQSEGRQPVSKPEFDKLVASAPTLRTETSYGIGEAEPIRQNREERNAVIAENNAAAEAYNKQAESYNARLKGQAEGKADTRKGVTVTADWTGGDPREGALDSAASKIANQIGVDYEIVRAELAKKGNFAEGEFTSDYALRKKERGESVQFGLDANKVSELQAMQRVSNEQKAKADAEYQQRAAKVDPNMDPAERELELLLQRGIADVNAGRTSYEEVSRRFQEAKKSLEAWKAENPIGTPTQSTYVSGRFGEDTSSPIQIGRGYDLTELKTIWEKDRQEAIKEYGSLDKWRKKQEQYYKTYNGKPMLAIAKSMEAAAGGAMQVPFQAAGALLQASAIAREGLTRGALAIGGAAARKDLSAMGDPVEATKATDYQIGTDIKKLAESIPVPEGWKGGKSELIGNSVAQVLLQAAVGVTTGGAGSFLVGATMGASDAYEQAKKFEAEHPELGKNPWRALGGAAAAALLAVPDIAIFGGEAMAPFLKSVRWQLTEQLVKRGLAKPMAEKAAVEAVEGLFDGLIKQGGYARVLGTAGKGLGTATTEAGQEVSENIGNDAYAYMTYDPSPERFQKMTTLLSKENVAAAIGGFFGGLAGGSAAEIQSRAAELNADEAQEVLDWTKLEKVRAVLGVEMIQKVNTIVGKRLETLKPIDTVKQKAAMERPVGVGEQKVADTFDDFDAEFGDDFDPTSVARPKGEAPLRSVTATRDQVLRGIANANPNADMEATRQLLPDGEYEVMEVPISSIGQVYGTADTERAGQYAQQDPKTAPPIVLDARGGVVDGKHRIAAARQRGDKTIRAWVPKQDAPLRKVSDLGFYSAVEKAIEQKMPNSATAEQVKGILKDTKEAEREWLGIDEFLAENPKPTKQELLDFVRSNQVELKEVTKVAEGDDSGQIQVSLQGLQRAATNAGLVDSAILQEMSRRGLQWEAAVDRQIANLPEYQRDALRPKLLADRDLREKFMHYRMVIADGGGVRGDKNTAQYEQYKLPGGENYRELLLTLPYETKGMDEQQEGESLMDALRRNQAANPAYRSSHWSEKNVLAHIRFDERTDDQGRRTLHVAEIQSDWHQAGRKQGYQKNLTAQEKEYAAVQAKARDLALRVTNFQGDQRSDEWKQLIKEKSAALRERDALAEKLGVDTMMTGEIEGKGVPDAPFKKSWHELAFKRVLRYAVENGFDAVSWDTGDTNTDRYSLEKQIDQLEWNQDNGRLYATQKGTENQIKIADGVTNETLADYVGKEVADKLIAQPMTGSYKYLGGVDLKTGGEGMRGFYDKMLPAFANKYVKKWGSKVEQGSVDAGSAKSRQDAYGITQEDNGTWTVLDTNGSPLQEGFSSMSAATRFRSGLDVTAPIHSVQITPAMRESVMGEGQPLHKVRTDALMAEQQRIRYAPKVSNLLAEGIEGKYIQGKGLEITPATAEFLRRLEKANTGNEIPISDGLFYSPNVAMETSRWINTFLDRYKNKLPPATQKQLTALARQFASMGRSGEVVFVFDDAVKHEQLHQLSFMASGGKRLTERIKDLVGFAQENQALIQKAFDAHYQNYGYRLPALDQGVYGPLEMAAIAELVEEMAISSLAKEQDRIGLTDKEAATYIQRWLSAYKEHNGPRSLKAFETFFKGLEQSDNELNLVREAMEDAQNKIDEETEAAESEEAAIPRPSAGLDLAPSEAERAGRTRGLSTVPEPAARAADSETGRGTEEKQSEQADTGEQRERGVIKSAERAGINVADVQNRYYTVKHKNDQIRAAQEKIDRIGLAAAINEASQPAVPGQAMEQNTLRMEVVQLLNNQARAAVAAGNKAMAQAKLDAAQSVVSTLADSGTDWGQGISILSEWQQSDPNAVTGYVQKRRAQNQYNVPLEPKQAEELRAKAEEVADLQAQVDELRKKLEAAGTTPAPRKRADKNPNIERLEKSKAEIVARLTGNPLRSVALKRPTKTYGESKENGIDVDGYHFSKESRPTLDTTSYGTGLSKSAGAEAARLAKADPRLSKRLYFYVDRGLGIRAESGVGNYAHAVKLQGMYDANKDPLKLAKGDRNAFETAVLDAGFPGYVNREMGMGVLLGDHKVDVEQLGQQKAGKLDIEPAALLNIGLDIPNSTDKIKQADVIAAVEAAGGEVVKKSSHQSDTEETMVIELAKPLSAKQADGLSSALKQEAIVQYADGKGDLYGPMAEKWGPFNPEYFVMPDGRRMADAAPLRSVSADPVNEAKKAYFKFKNDLFGKYGVGFYDAARNDDSRLQKIVSPEDWTGYKRLEKAKDDASRAAKTEAAQRLAPNGKPSNLSKELYEMVRTPNFKRWFGDWEKGDVWSRDDVSKIVDENGEPLVVYHGTTVGGFGVFDPSKSQKTDGVTFFTKDRHVARTYSGSEDHIQIPDDSDVAAWWNDEGGANEEQPWDLLTEMEKEWARDSYRDEVMESQRGLYPVFLNIRNPYETNFEGANWDGSRTGYQIQDQDGERWYAADGTGFWDDEREAYETLSSEEGFENADIEDGEVLSEDGEPLGFRIKEADDHYETTDSAAKEGTRDGQDGAIIRDVRDPGQFGDAWDTTDVFTINNPNQVKSIYNTGEFNPNDDRILRRVSDPKELAQDKRFEISTRQTKNAKETQIIDLAAMSSVLPKAAALMRTYPGLTRLSKKPELAARQMIDHIVENLLWLHDQMPADMRSQAKLWYDSARMITFDFSDKYNVTRPQVAGVIAALSPQKDWFQNVSLAERTLDIIQNKGQKKVNDALIDPVRERVQMYADAAAATKSDLKRRENLQAMGSAERALKVLLDNKGKSIADVPDEDKPYIVRAYDEVFNDRSYNELSPRGEVTGIAQSANGPAKAAWGSYGEIGKAVNIILDGSKENISANTGNAHKVRNFYNNILLPNDPNQHVTIDTHAVAAALLRPLAGNDTEVSHVFGPAPSVAATGSKGIYGLYADAYRKAAAERGLLAREMQSIAWEGVRALFSPEFKTAANKAKIADIWRKERDRQKVFAAIERAAGGIETPSWYERGPAADDQTGRGLVSQELSGVGRGDRRTGTGRGVSGESTEDLSAPLRSVSRDPVSQDEKKLLADYAAIRILEDRTLSEVIEDLRSVAPRATDDEIADAHLAAWDMIYPHDSKATMTERARIRLEHYRQIQRRRAELTAKPKKEIDPEFKKENPKAGPRKGELDPRQNQNVKKQIDPEWRKENPKAGPRMSEGIIAPEEPSADALRLAGIADEMGIPSHELHAAILIENGEVRDANEAARALVDLYGLTPGEALNTASKGAKFRQQAQTRIREEKAQEKRDQAKTKAELDALNKKKNTAARELLTRIKGLEQPPPGYMARTARVYKAALVSALQTSVNNLLTAQATRKLMSITDLTELMLNKGLAKLGREIPETAIQPGVKVRDIFGIPTNGKSMAETVQKTFTEAIYAKGLAQSVLDEFPTFYEELFASYASDIAVLPEKKGAANVGEKAMRAAEWTVDKANILNKLQEFFVRSQEFNRVMQIRLAGRGQNYQQLVEDGRVLEINPEDIKVAVQAALTATFARTPDKNTLFGKAIDAYESKVPALLAPLLVTFPRFAYNATGFITDYTPVVGLIKAGAKQKQKGGTYWEGFKDTSTHTVAQQLVGTTLFLTALSLVRALGDDDDWYNLKVPGYYIDGKQAMIDVRGYQPFASFIYMANKINRLIDGKPMFSDPDKAAWEVAEAVMGISQRNLAENKLLAAAVATGKGLTGLGDDKEWERVSYLLQQQLGDIAGGFMRPLKTIKDLVAQYDSWTGGREAQVPDLIDRPVAQGVARSLPFANKILDAAPRKDFVTDKETRLTAPGLKVLGVTIEPPDRAKEIPSPALVKIRELDEGKQNRDILPKEQRERAVKGSIWAAIRKAGTDIEAQKAVFDALQRAQDQGILTEGQAKYIERGVGLTELQSRIKATEWKNIILTLQVMNDTEIESVRPVIMNKWENARRQPNDEEAAELAKWGLTAPMGKMKSLPKLKSLESLKSLP